MWFEAFTLQRSLKFVAHPAERAQDEQAENELDDVDVDDVDD